MEFKLIVVGFFSVFFLETLSLPMLHKVKIVNFTQNIENSDSTNQSAINNIETNENTEQIGVPLVESLPRFASGEEKGTGVISPKITKRDVFPEAQCPEDMRLLRNDCVPLEMYKEMINNSYFLRRNLRKALKKQYKKARKSLKKNKKKKHHKTKSEEKNHKALDYFSEM